MAKSLLFIIVFCFGGLVFYGLIDLLASGLATDIGILVIAGGLVLSAGLYITNKFWWSRIPDDEEE